MKKSIILLFLACTLLLGYLLVQYKKPASRAIFPSSTPTESIQLLGEDKDEHGCTSSAGYSWCEAKQKCLRSFEEDCDSIEKLKIIFANEHNKALDKVFVKISRENSKYAVGGVKFDRDEGPGGAFLAVKTGDSWEIVYEGNGSIDCRRIKGYGFPQEMLVGFCD